MTTNNAKNKSEMRTIAASQTGHCLKQLYLAATDAEPSNATTAESENMRNAGNAMKAVVGAALTGQDWDTGTLRRAVHIPVTDTIEIAGMPDQIMSHPEITQGNTIVCQTGAAKHQSMNRWLRETSENAYPDRLNQLALITDGLLSDPEPPAEIAGDAFQMIVMMNRDNGEIEYEVHETQDLLERSARIKERVKRLDEALSRGEMPDAEFSRDSRSCRQCPYLDMCHGKDENEVWDDEVVGEASEEKMLDALRTYIRASKVYEEHKSDINARERARKIVRAYMIERGLDEKKVEEGEETWTLTMAPSNRVNLSMPKARDLLTTSQIAAISSQQGPYLKVSGP